MIAIEGIEMSWIAELVKKRNACHSAVVIVETNDEKRIDELTRYVLADNKGWNDTINDRPDAERYERTLYAYDTLGTLQQLDAERKPVNLTDDSSGGFGASPLDTIAKALMTAKGLTVIMKNVLQKEDLSQKHLNAWSTNGTLFSNDNTVIVFVPDRGCVVPPVLDREVLVVPPISTREEREAILRDRLGLYDEAAPLNDYPMLDITDSLIQQLVDLSGGLDLNQTEAAFLETIQDAAANAGKVSTGVVSKVKAEMLNKLGLKVDMNPKGGFERVGGYQYLKDFFEESVVAVLKEPERAAKLGVRKPRGVLIFGPPGTGKTIISKAVASVLTMPFITLSPEQYMTSLVGESEKQLREVFKRCEAMAPCIIYVDEMDRLGGRGGPGGETDGGTQGRLFTMFLEYMGDEDRQTFFIGTTNKPEMDEAFTREGRFDALIPMLSPNAEARYQIFLVQLNVRLKLNHRISDGKLRAVATRLEGWKGNMVEELCKRAARTAFIDGSEVVTEEHLDAALKDYRPNLGKLSDTEETYKALAEKLCNSNRFLDALKLEEGQKVVQDRPMVVKEKTAAPPAAKPMGRGMRKGP